MLWDITASQVWHLLYRYIRFFLVIRGIIVLGPVLASEASEVRLEKPGWRFWVAVTGEVGCLFLVTCGQGLQWEAGTLTAQGAGNSISVPNPHVPLPQRLQLLLVQLQLCLWKKTTCFFKHPHWWNEQVQQAGHHFHHGLLHKCGANTTVIHLIKYPLDFSLIRKTKSTPNRNQRCSSTQNLVSAYWGEFIFLFSLNPILSKLLCQNCLWGAKERNMHFTCH